MDGWPGVAVARAGGSWPWATSGYSRRSGPGSRSPTTRSDGARLGCTHATGSGGLTRRRPWWRNRLRGV